MFNYSNPRGLMRRFALEAMAPAGSVAMEEDATGVAKVETEFVFYAHMGPSAADVLKTAELIEGHEQWELRIPQEGGNASGGRMRVRMTTTGDQVEYVRTTKTKLPDGSENEVALPSSVDEFKQFKAMSPRGMLKTRHVFAIPRLKEKWEVDTYIDPTTGELSPWMKIDLELDAETERKGFALPKFPDGLVGEDYHILSKGARSKLIQDAISWLYEYIFITPNPDAPTKTVQEKLERPEMPEVRKLAEPIA